MNAGTHLAAHVPRADCHQAAQGTPGVGGELAPTPGCRLGVQRGSLAVLGVVLLAVLRYYRLREPSQRSVD